MSRAIFISIIIHLIAISLILFTFKQNRFSINKQIKTISLSSIKLENIQNNKAQSKKLKAKSSKLKAKNQEIRTKSSKKNPTAKRKKLKAKNIKQKALSKIEVHRAKSKKQKAKSRKLKAKSRKKAKSQELRAKSSKKKLKAQRIKHKAKNNKRKVKNHKLVTKHQTKKSPITSKQLPVTNNKSPISNFPNIKAKIYQAINNAKVYPRLAKKMNLQGSIYTCFTISPGGNVSNITTSGAHAILQRGARQTIKRAKQNFPPVPGNMNICVSINFILE